MSGFQFVLLYHSKYELLSKQIYLKLDDVRDSNSYCDLQLKKGEEAKSHP